MTARACLVELTNLTRGLRRETLPHLPPSPGYEGDDDWNYQVALWKKWIKWEKDDPVVLAKEDPVAFRGRIVYAYKQALMALRFWPEMWFEAADYCLENGMDVQGIEFLRQGLQANPESTLLTFKYAERLEAITPAEDGEAAAVRKGQLVRKPYDDLLNTLYGHYAKMQAREKEEIEKLGEEAQAYPESPARDDDDDDDERQAPEQSFKERRINEVKERSKAEMLKLSRVISAVWINLMRAMRRIQGHGRVNEPLGGSRQIFADARKRGKITSDVYVASALIEYHCYRDPAALKIFERGMKLFPEDEDFALEYLKHLVNINDITSKQRSLATYLPRADSHQMPGRCLKPLFRRFQPRRPSGCTASSTNTKPATAISRRSTSCRRGWPSCTLQIRNSTNSPPDMLITPWTHAGISPPSRPPNRRNRSLSFLFPQRRPPPSPPASPSPRLRSRNLSLVPASTPRRHRCPCPHARALRSAPLPTTTASIPPAHESSRVRTRPSPHSRVPLVGD